MKKMFFLSTLLPLLFAGVVHAQNKETVELQKALRAKRSGWFRSVKWDKLEQALLAAGKGPSPIAQFGFKAMPAIAGGLKNRDVRVRNAVYGELRFEMQVRGYGTVAMRIHSRNPELMREVQKIRRQLRRQREKEPFAKKQLQLTQIQYALSVPEIMDSRKSDRGKGHDLAKMDPEAFKNTNVGEKMSYIGEMGKAGLKTLLAALKYARGNPETQLMLVEELKMMRYSMSMKERKQTAPRLKKIARAQRRNKKLAAALEEAVKLYNPPAR